MMCERLNTFYIDGSHRKCRSWQEDSGFCFWIDDRRYRIGLGWLLHRKLRQILLFIEQSHLVRTTRDQVLKRSCTRPESRTRLTTVEVFGTAAIVSTVITLFPCLQNSHSRELPLNHNLNIQPFSLIHLKLPLANGHKYQKDISSK